MPRPRNPDFVTALAEAFADALVRKLGTRVGRGSSAAAPKKRRKLSPEGRARIIAAAKKRWAEYRKKQGG